MGLNTSISSDFAYTNCDKVDKLMLVIAARFKWLTSFHSSTINQHINMLIQNIVVTNIKQPCYYWFPNTPFLKENNTHFWHFVHITSEKAWLYLRWITHTFWSDNRLLQNPHTYKDNDIRLCFQHFSYFSTNKTFYN